MTEKYLFLDRILRKEIQETINKQYSEGYDFVAFLQSYAKWDYAIGILFKRRDIK